MRYLLFAEYKHFHGIFNGWGRGCCAGKCATGMNNLIGPLIWVLPDFFGALPQLSETTTFGAAAVPCIQVETQAHLW